MFDSIASWTPLAWGQQFVRAATAAVLNSTAPIFVLLFTAFAVRVATARVVGALLGLAGVALIVGEEALDGFGAPLAGQAACLAGAALYACAALYGRRFAAIGPLPTAAGTMICAAIALTPLAFLIDAPFSLSPSPAALGAALTLGLACTALYFRLLATLGPLGTASQTYLRAGVGALLGAAVLGETLSLTTAMGIVAAVFGVTLVNWRRA